MIGGAGGGGGYGGSGGGGKVNITATYTNTPSIGNGAFTHSSFVGSYGPTGYLGYDGSSVYRGLQYDNGASKAAWVDFKYYGSVPAGTTVQIQVRPSDTLGSGTFYDPITNTASTWSATIPVGTYTVTPYTITSSSSFKALVSKTVEIIIKMTGGSTTPTLTSFTVDSDALDAPTNPKQYKTDTTTQIASSGWTNETSLVVKADVPDMAPIPTTGETLTPQIELLTGASPTFTGNNTTFPSGGVAYAPATYSYAGTATNINFGTLSGLTPGTIYNWKIRFTDQAGRVGPWSATANVLNIDQTAPTLTSISAGAANTNNKLITITLTGAADANSGLGQMRFSNDGTTWSTWENYLASKSNWDLTAYPTNTLDGTRTVYAQIMDNAGNVAGSNMATVTGGTITSSGNNIINTFTTSGTLTVTGGPIIGTTVLVVAGGGGGGGKNAGNGGGGGAGGVVNSTQTINGAMTVTVGGGGNAGATEIAGDGGTNGSNGANSVLGSITAIGGGGGARYAGGNGLSGGSGGGSAQTYSAGSEFGGSGTAGQGNAGGKNTNNPASLGGGGGGAGEVGQNGNTGNIGGHGGAGIGSSISGVLTYYGGGGGASGTGGTGGLGGGGNYGAAGTPNTGGGGGAGGAIAGNAGAGGSGIVIISHQGPIMSSITLDTTAPNLASGTLTSPNGGETWKGGTSHAITWDKTKISDAGSGLKGTAGNQSITLSYSTDGGTGWTQLATNEDDDGTYTWNPIPSFDNTTVKVRIVATDNVGNVSTPTDSVANFIIDSTAPTGTVSALGQYFNTAAINAPYTTGDVALSDLATPVSVSTGSDFWDGCEGPGTSTSQTVSNPAATSVQVTWSWNSRKAGADASPAERLLVNGSVVLTKGVTYPSGTVSETTGWYSGNTVSLEVYAGACSRATASISQVTYRLPQTISGVKNAKLYYTRQTSANYTWAPYPNAGSPTNFATSPATFDTALIADATKNGNYGFKLVIEDNAGNISAIPGASTAPDATTFIDTVAPTTSGSVTAGTVGTNSWYTSDVTYTLAPADTNGSGIKSTVYCIDTAGSCSPVTAYTVPLTLSTETATNHVRWKSTDNADNVQPVQDSGAIKIDKAAPTTTGAITGGTTGSNSWYTTDVTYTLTPADATSGLLSTSYCIDTAGSCTPSQAYSSPLTISTESASNHIRWSSTDNAGNVQAVQDSGEIKIDKSAPAGTIVINNGDLATQDINVRLNLNFSDAGSSALATYELSNDNGGTWAAAVSISTNSFSATNVPLTLPTGEGTKTVAVRVKDNAGNTVSNISDTIFIDTVAPNDPSAIAAQKSDVDNTAINQLTWYPTTTPYFSWTATDVNPGSGIKGYWVYFGTNSNGDPLNSSLPAKERFFLPTNHFFPNLPTDGYLEGKYYLKVRSVDNVDLVSASDSEFIYFYDKTPPSNVTGLAATNDVLNKITVSWNAYSITSQEAPLEKYEIERVKAQYYYDHNLQVESGDWSAGTGYTKFSIYRNDPIFNAHTFDDTTVDIGVRYHYRIRAKDLSNVEMGPWQASGLVYGLTLDNVAPEVPPSAVTVGVCSTGNPGNCTNSTNKGHEIKVTWLGGTDAGSGMLGYKIYRHEVGSSADWVVVGFLDVSGPGPHNLVWQDNDTNNAATWAGFKGVVSPNVNDHTNYEYRVTGLDAAATPNETALILENPMTNWNAAEERTPDVTAPPKPTGLTAAALGLDDSDASDETIGHQWIRVRWIQTPDTNLYGGSGSGITTIRLLRATVSGGPYVDVTDDTTYPVTCSLVNWDCTQKRLPDITTYYYKVKVIDAVGLSSGDSDGYTSIKTALSTAPTPPQNVVVSHDNGDPSTDGSTVGKKLHISFTGSYAKGCLNNISCVVAYEVYRSTTNLSTPEEWLDPTLATHLPDVSVNFARDERGVPRTFDDSTVVDGTRYYYKLRARDNTPSDESTNTVGPFYSTFSEIDETSPQGLRKGWDITPYVTQPGITATDADGGIYSNLEVKVRDTHPNSSDLRNIISWRPVDMPLRRKLAYETCTGKQVDGINYCNNFAKYVIYREELASDGSVMKDGNGSEIIVKIAEITDQQTNYVIDTLSLLFKDNIYSYYVQVVDKADTLSYPSPYTSTLVNTDAHAANVSIPSYAADSIIPGKTTPKIEGNVTVPDDQIGVSSATVVWTTDQPTDGVVEFRRKYKAGNSGDLNDGSYQVIGEDTSPTQGSSKPTHSVKLFGLEANTAYDYRVVSKNYLSNAATKGGNDVPALTTKGFSITVLDTQPDDITTVSATIRWTTNMPSNTNVLNFRQTDGTQAGSPAETSLDLTKLNDSQKNCTVTPQLCNHEVSISPLKKNTKYGFSIVSVSLDNYYASSDIKYFTTANSDLKQFTVVPSASNVAERNITSTSAQIVFQTSEETTATLFYGNESGAPDYKESRYKLRSTDSVSATTHVILIDGLEPGKKYYYVVSVSNGLLTYTSPEASFTAVLKPKIDNLQIAEVKPYSFRITWTTNIETDSLINLGTSTNYGEKRGTPGLVKTHDLLVEQLNDNTEYHFQILAKDETGNEVATQDYAVRTPMDTEGPKISGVKIDVLPMGENDNTSSVIVSWQTDKPASTLVEYDEGVIGGNYGKRSVEDSSLGASHTVIIKDLLPASSYHYRLVSADKRNNKTISQDYTFVTPSKEKSILQLILKSLEETFAWTRNLNQFFGNIGKRLTGK